MKRTATKSQQTVLNPLIVNSHHSSHHHHLDDDEEQNEPLLSSLREEKQHELLIAPILDAWTLHIRCATSQQKEFDVTISTDATIKQLLDLIIEKLQINETTHTVRLIHQGKLLSNSLGHGISSELKNNSFIHVAISPKIRRNSSDTSSIQHHRIIPANTSDGSSSSSGLLRGLDTLRERNPYGAVLSSEDVEVLRSSFQESIQQYALRHHVMRNMSEETEEDFRYRLEQEWMEAQSPFSEFRLNIAIAQQANQSSSPSTAAATMLVSRFYLLDDGSNPFSPFLARNSAMSPSAGSDRNTRSESEGTAPTTPTSLESFLSGRDSSPPSSFDATASADLGSCLDFFYGIALGYMIGFIVIFCIWDRNVSYRQKLGLLVGIMLQILTNMMWGQYAQSMAEKGIGRGASGGHSGFEQNPSGSMDFYNQRDTGGASLDSSGTYDQQDGLASSAMAAMLNNNHNRSPASGGGVSIHHIIGPAMHPSSHTSLRGNSLSVPEDNHPLLSSFPFAIGV